MVVFHHEPALSYHLNNQDFISISPFENIFPYASSKKILKKSPYENKNDIDKLFLSSEKRCIAVVDTFQGINGIPTDEYKRKMINALDSLDSNPTRIIYLGKNNNIKLNKFFASNFPKYRAKIYIYINTQLTKNMKVWRNE